MAKLHNPNRCKIHRSYSVEDIAALYQVHKNTVRNWIKDGLPICDDVKPMLILGAELKRFLQQKRVKNKRVCKPNEIYCLKCREPKMPVHGTVEVMQETAIKGRMLACCPTCNSLMNKYFKWADLASIHDLSSGSHKTTK